ncbi:hypothetical protein ACFV1X_37265 [Streptomyces coelicoflavus]|uniref:hypothetical protein n=1 Tax=Streptomyces coelicoflavus TaxID=285562 RepID=UPI0036A74241
MLEVIIAATAGLLGAALGSWATMRAARTAERAALTTARITSEPRKADVEFVDASFVVSDDLDPTERTTLLGGATGESDASGLFLDLKLRNRGGETAYLYELTLDMRNSIDGFQPELPKTFTHHAMRTAPSHVYRAAPKEPRDRLQTVRISQVLPPDEVDRFLVSVPAPPRFIRARVSVVYNGGLEAAAVQELKFLHSHPQWINADSLITLLSLRLSQCGPYADWKGRRVPLTEVIRLCMEEYEQGLQDLADHYAEVHRETDPRCVAIHGSRIRVVLMRQALIGPN